VPTNFDTDCFSNIIHEIEKTCDKTYDSQNFFKKDLNQEEINKCFRIITDHIKANVFAINDGATLSNNGRGSILRRLLRRSMVCARKLGCSMNFIQITVNAIINEYKNFFQMIEDSKIQIIEILENERKTFESALERGMRMFEKEIEGKSFIQSDIIFKLVDTYGFPFEIIKELCEQNNISFDTEKYYEFVAQHQKISRGDFENKGMNIQSKDLIKFEEPSVFLYDTYELNDVNIIAIFDTNFNKIEKAQNQC
jgi:alanyl-tRNA synthetase